jgi:hypothetical protein
MKTFVYIVFGYVLLQSFAKHPSATAAAQARPEGSAGSLTRGVYTNSLGQNENVIYAADAPDNPLPGQTVVIDESGDLAIINSTGGTSVLPDPNGIGGGFAT